MLSCDLEQSRDSRVDCAHACMHAHEPRGSHNHMTLWHLHTQLHKYRSANLVGASQCASGRLLI